MTTTATRTNWAELHPVDAALFITVLSIEGLIRLIVSPPRLFKVRPVDAPQAIDTSAVTVASKPDAAGFGRQRKATRTTTRPATRTSYTHKALLAIARARGIRNHEGRAIKYASKAALLALLGM